VGLEHPDIVADYVADREQRNRRTGHDQVHAVELERASQTAPHDIEGVAFRQSGIVNHCNGEADMKTKASAASEKPKLRGVRFSRILPGT
jgi:hypothetical protein